jgi:pilus assembly protein Flp/PilA
MGGMGSCDDGSHRNLRSSKRKITLMLKYYIKAREAVERLRTDKDGVVSLEYVIVGAVVCVVVLALFNGTGTASLQGALTSGFNAISAAMTGLPTP